LGATRRVAERMIVERAERARRIAAELRSIALRLEGQNNVALAAETAELRSLADQVERL
jgi:hypothetical protein